MELTVRDILRMPFFLRSASENLKIILKGKPRPKMFNSEWFDKEQWLTACDRNRTFFCWPCLLFVQEISEWNKNGFADTENLFSAFEEHKNTPAHIGGVLKLQLFLNENLVQVTERPEIKTIVKRNRNIVKRIVDTLCHLASIKTPVYNGVSVSDQNLGEDCIRYLRVLKTYDLQNSCDEAINLIEAQDSKVLSNVVTTLTKLIATQIKEEIQSSSFVSLIFSEHSEITLKAKLSNVLRYVKDGKVLERFIGFSHCIAYKSSHLMLSNISGIVSKFDIPKKLFTLSCDGAVMSMKHLKAVLTSLKRDVSLCFLFVPCYYHDFDFILQQSVSGFQECHLFFQNLRSIKCYLQESPKIRLEFNAFMNDNIPNFCDLKLSDSQFLRVLRMHRRQFIIFFTDIQINHSDYRQEELSKASGFVKLLQELQTIFLLESFYVLFESTAIFSETLNTCYPENVFENSFIENIQTTLKGKREESFLSIWNLTMTAMTELPDKPGRELEQFKRRFYYQLYNKVMDHLASEIEIRFISLEKLNFFHILNYECQGKFLVSDDYIKNLMTTFGHFFNKYSLKTELNVINSNSTGLVGNSVYDLLQTLVSRNLQDVFKNVVKLAELILSMPCKPPSPSGNTSKYNLINSWSTVLGNGNMLDEFSVLAIEIDVLQDIMSQPNFYDNFMTAFQTLNNTLQVT